MNEFQVRQIDVSITRDKKYQIENFGTNDVLGTYSSKEEAFANLPKQRFDYITRRIKSCIYRNVNTPLSGDYLQLGLELFRIGRVKKVWGETRYFLAKSGKWEVLTDYSIKFKGDAVDYTYGSLVLSPYTVDGQYYIRQGGFESYFNLPTRIWVKGE